MPDFTNVYDDAARADAYSRLEFPGTYFLAYRDLPAIIARHVRGTRALDFGCGAGRSTRFLRALGWQATGVDIAEPMLARARALDPGGDCRLVPGGDVSGLPPAAFELVLSVFTFDNVPGLQRKVALLRALKARLRPGGRLVSLVSAPEIYVHEWASFSTREFPQNRAARSGDKVLITMLDVPDHRPVEDVLCTDADWRAAYASAGLVLLEVARPLGRPEDGQAWVSEGSVAPWVVYVLAGAD
jgi:SAM-dependent methyltransferase